MKRPPSAGTASIYSHSIHSVRSVGLRSTRSVPVPWYKKPLITQEVLGYDVQKLALYMALFSLIESLFTIGTSCFDIYCLSEATPGSKHYGYYLISFDFVYVGNQHVRNALITIAVFSMVGGVALFITTIQLVQALRKEHERRMIPWLVCMLVFAIWRGLAFIFFAILNDMIFAYNIIMCLFWTFFTIMNFGGWAAVYTLFLELSDLTKLEDLAHLRMGTMASLATQSIQGSRPVTPHSVQSLPYHNPSVNI
ncbi:uncharacterized protein LOC110848652 [Folsomia candida]|uniref:Uncharacterized protein n=1 Tax=Folsomia candida TaxID=158441 RepID=A0A226EDT8_FOLCA|nr:uncharacterized protein LOC110848652 [Folsomia candida]OXA55569.1 hypothetical protein Fcan01_10027 [Folsomia candida]